MMNLNELRDGTTVGPVRHLRAAEHFSESKAGILSPIKSSSYLGKDWDGLGLLTLGENNNPGT